MKRIARLSITIAAVLSLTACLIPEKFETSVRFKPDGGYTYKYDGTTVHVIAAMAIKEKGSLPPKEEGDLKRDAEEKSKAPGVRKMTYSGNGRYDIHIEQDLQPGQEVKTLRIFRITRDKGGVFVVSAPPIKGKDRDQLQSLAIKLDGKAEVFLPGNARVLEHNANSTPGLLSKSYSWNIRTFDGAPMIKFSLAQ